MLHMIAKPGIKPKELVAAVRAQHPEATKKEIVRAAFYTLTHAVDADAEKARHLHDSALTERAGEEQDALLPKKLRKKERRKDREAQPAPN